MFVNISSTSYYSSIEHQECKCISTNITIQQQRITKISIMMWRNHSRGTKMLEPKFHKAHWGWWHLQHQAASTVEHLLGMEPPPAEDTDYKSNQNKIKHVSTTHVPFNLAHKSTTHVPFKLKFHLGTKKTQKIKHNIVVLVKISLMSLFLQSR